MTVEFTIGEYTITLNSSDHLEREMFLRNSGGEGMTLYSEELERMLDKHFKENF